MKSRLAVVMAAAVMLSGCGSDPFTSNGKADEAKGSSNGVTPTMVLSYNSTWIGRVELPTEDGKMVTCFTYNGDKEGSISCDWDHPHPKK